MSTEMAADFKAYQDRVTASLVNVTRSAAGVASHDLSFHRSLSDKVSKSLDAQNVHLLRLTSKLLRAATKDTNIKAPALKDRDAVDDNWRGIVDVVDNLLEKADASLDEFTGVIKRMSPSVPGTPEPAPKPRYPSNYSVAYGIPKPQLQFDRKVDNYETGPWKPLLTSKPHALVSLEESIGTASDTGYKHPYTHEIQTLEYPTSVRTHATPIPFTRPERSAPVWVDTEEGVHEMLEELKLAKEIAVDLEHNDKNSYVGLVSLMQISTRDKDWIVDTLRPWRENLQILNQVFADPKILKVFHGSTSDMVWLQRDLGLYVVGLFDTYYAANVLRYPQRSLAYLLSKHCNFAADKKHQMADWRIRPLPQELLDYARSDTHYLLYIYDCLRNELVKQSTPDNDLIDYVLDNSKKESLQVYERHDYDRDNGLGSNGWLKILMTRNTKTLTPEQFGVLRALHEWRDQKARELDEGDHTIMSHAFLWTCAESMPQNHYQLFHNGRGPAGKASYYVSQYSQQVLDTIKRGQASGKLGPSVQEVMDRNADKLSTFRQFKHANPNPKPQDVQRSVAATMQQLAQNGDLAHNGISSPSSVNTEGSLAMRSKSSQLWGSMHPTVSVVSLDPTIAQRALEFILPIPDHIEVTSLASAAGETASPVLADTVPGTITNNDIRVVDEPDLEVPMAMEMATRKRPADEFDNDDVPLSVLQDADRFKVTDEGRPPTIRELKRARKAAEMKIENDARKADFQPFDYANAQSILHAPKEASSTDTGSSSVKALNPFAKALDTTTGAKRSRMGKELAGKSHTFKS